MLRFLAGILFPTLALFWSAYYFAEIMQKPPAAGLIVKPLFCLIGVLYLAICRSEFKRSQCLGHAKDATAANAKLYCKLSAALVVSSMYAASTFVFGFKTATFVFLLASFLFWGTRSRRPSLAVFVALAVTLLLFELFLNIFHVPLPRGRWG